MVEINLFEDNLKLLKDLAKENNINEQLIDYISLPEVVFKVTFPVRMDDGSIRVFKGYRSRYSTLLGPAKGGIRYKEDIREDTINGLSLMMMIKNALVGLPYGGGKGGVSVDTSKLSYGEIERVSRAYMRAISQYIGPYVDVPAPDVATNGQIMAFFLDEYEQSSKVKAPAVVTGKPIELGGSLFRTEATGYGVHIVTDLFAKKVGKESDKTSIAIQGFGNLGSYLAQYLEEKGYKIIAISDIKGAIYSENGINIKKIIENLKASNKRGASIVDSDVSGFDKTLKQITNNEILELDVDILIPAALENVITKENVARIKAKYIVEGANEPITSEADKALEEKGVLIIPGALANAGGVIVSYFEWVQNIQFERWEEDEIKNKLIKNLTRVFNEMWELKEKQGKSLRSASYYLALKRLESVFKIKFNI